MRSGLMFDDFSRCESPIEALLQLAMAATSRLGRLEWCDADNIEDLVACASDVIWPCVLVGGQVNVAAAKARPDFIMAQPRFGAARGNVALLAVECDGEEFHHGNRDAVVKDRKRDERLNGAGIVPLRLRGTWITLDPIESVRACLMKLCDSQPPFYRPPPLRATPRRWAAEWTKRRDDLGAAARSLSIKSDLETALGASTISKRETFCEEALGQ